jgi:hypothetical protein
MVESIAYAERAEKQDEATERKEKEWSATDQATLEEKERKLLTLIFVIKSAL